MKKILTFFLSLIFLIGAVGFIGNARAVPPSGEPDGKITNSRILVKFAPGTTEETKIKIHKKNETSVEETLPDIDVQVIKVPEGKEYEFIEKFKKNKEVSFAEPDFIAEAFLIPNDTYFGNQWGMAKIGSPLSWDSTTGSSSVKIAILDTGIDSGHGDLKDKISAAKNFTTNKTIADRNGHGTHVAGIAAATTNNAKGVAGVSYNSSLMIGKVLSDNGSGSYSWVANGIVWAANNGAKVINMSLGGPSASQALEDAINYAWGKGVIVVAAAGNENTSNPSFPAYYPNVIAVAATDESDNRASFSNFGNWVDIAAPGVNILSTYPRSGKTDRYAYLGGTSMASPFVAGLAALVWSTSHGTDNSSVRSQIESTADTLNDTSIGAGRINAAKAVSAE